MNVTNEDSLTGPQEVSFEENYRKKRNTRGRRIKNVLCDVYVLGGNDL